MTAFDIEGICLTEGHKKVFCAINPTILGTLSERLVSCPPKTVLQAQDELSDLDDSIAALHARRVVLKDKIRLAWIAAGTNGSDKRWRAVQAFGHQLRNAMPVLDGEQTPEAAKLEVFDVDEPDNEVDDND